MIWLHRIFFAKWSSWFGKSMEDLFLKTLTTVIELLTHAKITIGVASWTMPIWVRKEKSRNNYKD